MCRCFYVLLKCSAKLDLVHVTHVLITFENSRTTGTRHDVHFRPTLGGGGSVVIVYFVVSSVDLVIVVVVVFAEVVAFVVVVVYFSGGESVGCTCSNVF